MAAVGFMCIAAAHDLLGQFALQKCAKSHTSRTVAMLCFPDHPAAFSGSGCGSRATWPKSLTQVLFLQ